MARHHLEQVAAGEPLLGLPHDPRIGAWHGAGQRAVARGSGAVSVGRCFRCLPGQAVRAPAADGELVAVHGRELALAVHHVQLIGQVQDQVPLLRRAGGRQPDRLELEREVVSERSVQAQVQVVGRERRDHLADRREHGRPAAPVLLGQHALGLGDDHLDLASRIRAGHRIARPGAAHPPGPAAAPPPGRSAPGPRSAGRGRRSPRRGSRRRGASGCTGPGSPCQS